MQKPLTRLVVAISIDGRLAPPQGGKAELGGCGDRLALEESLAWADATLMGGGTLREHQTTCLIHSPKLIKQRLADKKTKQPIAIVASSPENQKQDWEFFKQPIKRWLINPNSDTQKSYSKFLLPYCYNKEFFFRYSWQNTLNELWINGINKLVLLGGAKLIASFLKNNLIDEMQLTLVPKMLGGSHLWTSTDITMVNDSMQEVNAWNLKYTKQLGSDEILIHYHRKSELPKNQPT